MELTKQLLLTSSINLILSGIVVNIVANISRHKTSDCPQTRPIERIGAEENLAQLISQEACT